MSKYLIHRWDVVFMNGRRVPMIYVKPDLAFLEFLKANNNQVMCTVAGTGTIYDGKTMSGIANKSCTVPNCRPNYYAKTGYYVITLWAKLVRVSKSWFSGICTDFYWRWWSKKKTI